MLNPIPSHRFKACIRGCLFVILPGAAILPGIAQSADPGADAGKYDVDASTGYRMERYRAPVPASFPGGITLDTDAMRAAVADDRLILIDVFPPKGLGPDPLDGHWVISEGHDTLNGAHWLPDVGRGHITPELEAYFRRNLERLTGDDPATPVVFFCTADCWQSWNASTRAADWGYTAVHWYPVGTDGWAEAGGELVAGQPLNFLTDEPDPPFGDETVSSSSSERAVTAFPDSARIALVAIDGEEIDIGKVRFSPGDDGTAAIDVTIEGAAFSDHFLNMFPFKCIADAPEWFCYLPYPYELDNAIAVDDLVDLEYQLLFVRRASSDFGIDTWNGVYYRLTPTPDGGFTGALLEGDLTVLQAPPDDPDTRPLDLGEFTDEEADRRRFPALIIRP